MVGMCSSQEDLLRLQVLEELVSVVYLDETIDYVSEESDEHLLIGLLPSAKVDEVP